MNTDHVMPPGAPVHPITQGRTTPIKITTLKPGIQQNRRRAPISDISIEPLSSGRSASAGALTPKSQSCVEKIKLALHGHFLFDGELF